jgi:hypothetical protein
MTVPVVFPDVELAVLGALRTALAARSEPYATGVTAGRTAPATLPNRLVTVRRDGGPRLDVTREEARLTVNVWHTSVEDCSALARLVRALLWALPDGAPVCRVRESGGPAVVPEANGRPHIAMTFDAIVRGADLPEPEEP